MLRTLIADDESPARKRLRKLLQPMADAQRLTVVDEAADGVEVLEKLAAQPVDVLFLDIRMPGLDGFEVLERIAPDNRPVVIFTTAYDDYAIRAFDANAVDYLLKPVAHERLEQAVAKAERLHEKSDARKDGEGRLEKLLDWIEAQAPAAAPPAEPAQTYIKQLSVPYRDRILIIPIEQLVSVEIIEGITRLHVLDDVKSPTAPAKSHIRQHIVNYTLEQLEANLDPAYFMRIHRSAIVQLNLIQEMIPWFSGRYKLVLDGNHEVIASRERSKVLKERLSI